jgi:NADPH:quinone reductase-like Zn-dependent oxidoreductase
MGQIEMHALGCECSGLVSRVGSAVKSLSVGDRVIAFADGTFSTFTRAVESQVVKIPESMTFESATTLPIVYGTAWRAIQVAQLVQGETVLIHAASGGLGQALIMLCQYFGAEIFTTVGTVEKRDFLKTQYGIPESHIFYSRDDSFAKDVMRATAGVGVDIIFNSISAELLRVTWQCIAPFGRFIELGKRDFAVNSRLEMAQFAPNVTFAAVDLVHLLEKRPQYGIEAWMKIMELIERGSIRVPQPITLFGMSEVEKALRIMQSGRHIGKLVLIPKKGETFQVSFVVYSSLMGVLLTRKHPLR